MTSKAREGTAERARHLYFNELNVAHVKKTRVWEVTSVATDAILGKISFWGAWRKYIFQPNGGTIYDHSCLREIADFAAQQTNEWRAGFHRRREEHPNAESAGNG